MRKRRFLGSGASGKVYEVVAKISRGGRVRRAIFAEKIYSFLSDAAAESDFRKWHRLGSLNKKLSLGLRLPATVRVVYPKPNLLQKFVRYRPKARLLSTLVNLAAKQQTIEVRAGFESGILTIHHFASSVEAAQYTADLESQQRKAN